MHPKTGAAQLVEIRERVEEIAVPKYVEVARPVLPKRLLFAHRSDEELLSYGVPAEYSCRNSASSPVRLVITLRVIDILVRNSIAKSALATPATLGVNPDEARQSHAFAPLRSKRRLDRAYVTRDRL